MDTESKICVIGHKRNGKTEVAKILHDDFGLSFVDSSVRASEIFIYDKVKHKYGYKTPEECFEDRVNRRSEWFELIREYNKDDKARLAKEILSSCDVYAGMRSNEELEECLRIGLVKWVLWVHKPYSACEGSDSFNISKDLAHYVIVNDGSLDDLRRKVAIFMMYRNMVDNGLQL